MTRKDFLLIANAIRTVPVPAGLNAYEAMAHRTKVAEHFADRLAPTNPGFNRQRFLDACVRETAA